MTNTALDRIAKQACTTIKAKWTSAPRLAGVIDDRPADLAEYESPPQPPIAEWGESGLPFAFVYDVEEQGRLGGTNAFNHSASFVAEVVYRYDAHDPQRRMSVLGRDVRGEIKRALMLDRNMGGLAFNTMYGRNYVEPVPDSDTLAVAIVEFTVDYFHSLTDPTVRRIQTSN